MLFSLLGDNKIEDYIIKHLHEGPETGPSLLSVIKQKKDKVSKETFYRILRKLLNEEVINKNKNHYQLNRHWLQKIHQFSQSSIEKKKITDTDHILYFQEGDKIRYTFKNPNLMGIYWSHTYDMIFDNHDPKIPILVFHPHEWLIHTRYQAESFFLGRPDTEKKLVWFALGEKTDLDKQFQKDWGSKYKQIGTGINLGIKNTEYINVLGDYVFKITVSEKFSKDINIFFTTHTVINETNMEELKKICNRNDTVKMLFTRSRKEAEKYRVKFKKYFYNIK